MATRYNLDNLRTVLSNTNETGKRLGMRGAGEWSVGTLGGSYLYLLEGDENSQQRIIDLGPGIHSATVALQNFLSNLHVVEMMRKG